MSEDGERERLEQTYFAYGASPRKQRAWSAENPGNVAIRRELVRALWDIAGPNLRSARSVLDMGCGSGWWLAHLESSELVSAELHGIDILESRVAEARRLVPDASVCVGDLRSLPYRSGAFDVVFLLTAISSLSTKEDCARTLEEAWRVLGPAGKIVVWEPRVPNPWNPDTTFVSARRLSTTLGTPEGRRALTLLPPLARRLGRFTGTLYPRMAKAPPLRTHRLVWWSKASRPVLP